MQAGKHMTGMLGVYLTAAELTKRGFIVSPTSRSAFGADLLVTDQRCRKAWSVQVKANRKLALGWILNPHVADSHSESHIYVFVNLEEEEHPKYWIVPSAVVAHIHKHHESKTGRSDWYWIGQKEMSGYDGKWSEVFEESSAVQTSRAGDV